MLDSIEVLETSALRDANTVWVSDGIHGYGFGRDLHIAPRMILASKSFQLSTPPPCLFQVSSLALQFGSRVIYSLKELM